MSETTDTPPAAARRPFRARAARVLRFAFRLGLTLTAILCALTLLYAFIPPVATLMVARWALLRPVERRWVPLEAISPHLVKAVVSSEDARFCVHHGVDWVALGAATDGLFSGSGRGGGASTLTMQTVKNLYLWPQRSYVRKAVELPLALGLDAVWSKRRILEVYLNIAEWGEGTFGIEAAARRYFRKPAADLTARESALLATALPSPLLRNPAAPSPGHTRLARRIMTRATGAGAWVACLR